MTSPITVYFSVGLIILATGLMVAATTGRLGTAWSNLTMGAGSSVQRLSVGFISLLLQVIFWPVTLFISIKALHRSALGHRRDFGPWFYADFYNLNDLAYVRPDDRFGWRWRVDTYWAPDDLGWAMPVEHSNRTERTRVRREGGWALTRQSANRKAAAELKNRAKGWAIR